jgi:hypothetical protein
MVYELVAKATEAKRCCFQWSVDRGGSDSVVKDRERHCLLIALIVRRLRVIICKPAAVGRALPRYNLAMKEIVFEIAQDADGGFTAEAIGESIFTQADNWDELRANVQEAVQAFYFDSAPPASIRLRLVRDEVLAVA